VTTPAQTFAAPASSRILRPDGSRLPNSPERYRVRGGGSISLPLRAGDVIELLDNEGQQSALLYFCDLAGNLDPGALGATATATAAPLQSLLAGHEASVKRLHSTLQRLQARPASARGISVFGPDSCAGQRSRFTVQRDGLLIAIAPGAAMHPGEQNPVTDLTLWVSRTQQPATTALLLPEPLADPLQDLRIDARTARAYFVKAGQYIQVIDVEGRQCSDFQAFSARKLDTGRVLALDATVTRTLLGRSYPAPGLPSKAFDADFEPLIEIVQDTVGRHDAFATACSARYYELMGYPGHVNCSDNFNSALQSYGVPPRRGWEALNYFYNTGIDAHHQLYMDEPWSRPGDFVLMRALTDLVCVSSACPDDIDAANAWNPTDIHIRTYADTETFPISVAYRMTPDAEPQITRQSGFHESFARFTRNFAEYRGFWLANRFDNNGPVSEYWVCRQKAVVMDLSPLRKFEVTGPDAEALLQYCLTRDVSKLSTGQVVYSAMCYENGGMIDDGTLFRLGQNNFRWIGGADFGGEWLRQQASEHGYQAWVRSSTDQLHNIAVQGPASRQLLRDLIWTPATQTALADLAWFRFTIGRIGGPEGVAVVVSRTGYTGELGYEIFCHPRDAAVVFESVWQAGQPHGLVPMGLEALDMVRIEAGLVFAHYDFSDQTDPFEAGIGFTVPLKSKTTDFIGRNTLLSRKEHPRYKFVGLDIDANEPVGHGDCVHIGRAQIGVVTSATRSPLLGRTIALARVDATHSAIGTAIEIGKLDGHQKRLPGRVAAFPHYDPDKSRPRA